MGATLATAMVAGLMFCFAHSVMPGLGTLDDRGFLAAFQRIDAAISNPWMMLTFLGSPVLTLAALLLHLPGRSPAVPWLGRRAGAGPGDGADHRGDQPAVERRDPGRGSRASLTPPTSGPGFEDRWVRWNVVRAVTSTGALGALSWALFVAGRVAG